MRNPFGALVERKTDGVWGGPLGQLVAAYLRDGDSARLSEDQAYRVAAVVACVGLIAQNVAALPLPSYRRLARGKQRLDARADPLARVLLQPNDWQSGQDWREQMTAHLLLRGNAYSWISWGQTVQQGGGLVDVPLMLVPLHPDRVEVYGAVDGQQRLRERRYRLYRDTGPAIDIPAEDMFHLTGLSSDGLTGRSVLADARDSIGVAISTQRYAHKLFSNDATPGVVLRHPGKLSKEAAVRLRESWDEQHRGEARKTAVLEEGMSLERLTMTADDAQFLETRKFQRAEIAGLFRVPPHLIGDVDRSTSWGSGIEQQQIGFLQFTLLPWLRKWEHTINRQLVVKDKTYFVEHSVEGFLRGDAQTRGQFYNQMVTLGIFTRNEVREMENRNPLDGLDEPLTPLNLSSGSQAPPAPGA